MAATYTHKRYGKSVLNLLNEEIKETIKNNLDIYYVFNQSFDLFYFYKFYNPLIGKKIRNLGKIAHRNNTLNYFKNIIDYITSNNLENDSAVLAYLYGSINHYILDSNVHPYVFYKTGVFKSNSKETYKYNGLHTRLEFMLDAFYYEYDKKKLYRKINIKEELLPDIKYSATLENILTYVFKKTYNYSNIGKLHKKAYKDCQLAFTYVMKDRYNIKKHIFPYIDIITTKRIKNIQYNLTNVNKIDIEIFNLSKTKWCHPCDNNIIYKTSVLDIYDESTKKSAKIITMLHNYFKNKKYLNKILDEIGNNSYLTGLGVNSNKKLQYFEF